MPLVVAFPGEAEQHADGFFIGKDVADISKGEAVFVKIPYTKDRAKPPQMGESLVPTSKLLSDNPSRDYKVASYPTFIVTDSNGNEIIRFTKAPSAAELRGAFKRVEDATEKATKRLNGNLEAARKAWGEKDYGKSLKAIEKNFKEGLVGLAPQEESIRLFNEIRDAAKGEIDMLAADKNSDAIKRMNELKNAFKTLDREFFKEIEGLAKK